MKIPFFLLLLVGLVWSIEVKPATNEHVPKQEEITIYLGPRWGSKILEVENPEEEKAENLTEGDSQPAEVPERMKQTTTTTTTTTTTSTNTPVTKSAIVDLSGRLVHANYEDSVFDQKTLNLSGLDLTGEDVKNILHRLNKTLLSHVARLDLSHNRVWELPAKTFPMELEYNLLELQLSHNWLQLADPVNTQTTRFELSRLRHLKKLSLSHCSLTTLDHVEFPPLEYLDLSDNRLVDLPSSLATLTTLQELNASHNRLRYIGSSPLASLTGLRVLNLSNNGLEKMWDDPLETLFSLEIVYLDHNVLSEPPKLYQFSGSYQPRMDVYMSGNPFKCDCAFTNIMNNNRLQVIDKLNVTCLDSNNAEWYSDDKPASQCSLHWETVKQKWTGAKEWFRDNRPAWETLYRSTGWLLFGITLGLIYVYRRGKKISPPPSQVPYNILDDSTIA